MGSHLKERGKKRKRPAILAVIGAGVGIGQIGNGVAQGIARQPEAAATIQTAGIILAALIEGAALFGLVITILFKFF